jgi:hypothetical protein
MQGAGAAFAEKEREKEDARGASIGAGSRRNERDIEALQSVRRDFPRHAA